MPTRYQIYIDERGFGSRFNGCAKCLHTHPINTKKRPQNGNLQSLRGLTSTLN